MQALKWTRRGQAVQDGAGKELAPVGTSRTGARRTFRVRLTGRIRAALPREGGCRRLGLFGADVLQALREAVSIDPTALHKFANVILRNADGAPARAEPNVRQSPFGTEEVNQGLGAPESFSGFPNGKKLHDRTRPEASSPVGAGTAPDFSVAHSISFRILFPRQPQHHGLGSRVPLSLTRNTSLFSFRHQEHVPGHTPLNVTLTMTDLTS